MLLSLRGGTAFARRGGVVHQADGCSSEELGRFTERAVTDNVCWEAVLFPSHLETDVSKGGMGTATIQQREDTLCTPDGYDGAACWRWP